MTASFTADTRESVMQRSRGRCDRCGNVITAGAHFHHRRPRGAGSTTRPESASPANCLLLHPACHDYIERHRTEAKEKGWLVNQHDDPRLMPVLVQGRLSVLFDDGSLREVGGTR